MFDKRLVFLILVTFFILSSNRIYAQGPNIKFDIDTADFGTIAEGDSVVFDFWFTNNGMASAKIKQAYPSCGFTCTSFI